MPQRLAAAELAAMGAIDSRAMEQITNNSNFEGYKLPVEDRLAFALLMNDGGSPSAIRFPMNSGKPTFEMVAKVLGKPAGSDEKREKFAQAFQEKIAEALPRGLGVFWDRVNGDEPDELGRYAKLVDTAFAHARSAAGI